jgi:hypothetical protein
MAPRSLSLPSHRLHQSTKPIHRFQMHFEPDLVLLRVYKHEFALPLDGRAGQLQPSVPSGPVAWPTQCTNLTPELRHVARGGDGGFGL